jgi:hypothetical protein
MRQLTRARSALGGQPCGSVARNSRMRSFRLCSILSNALLSSAASATQTLLDQRARRYSAATSETESPSCSMRNGCASRPALRLVLVALVEDRKTGLLEGLQIAPNRAGADPDQPGQVVDSDPDPPGPRFPKDLPLADDSRRCA